MNELLQERRGERNSALELCRILAMFMIVCCHFATHGSLDPDPSASAAGRLWWYALELGGNFGADVFVLLSGYFLIAGAGEGFRADRLLRLWGGALFWSVLLYALGLAAGLVSFSFGGLLRALLPIMSGQWWFATAYFVLYLLHPAINALLVSLDRRRYRLLLLILLTLWCLVPTFTPFRIVQNELCEFVLLYALGAYIRRYGGEIRLKSSHCLLLWLALTLITYGSGVLLSLLSRNSPALEGHALWFYQRTSLPTLLRSLFFFLTFERMPSCRNRRVDRIASAAFGVYLIHDHPIVRRWLWTIAFDGARLQSSLLLIPYSLAAAALVWALCTALELLRKWAFDAVFRGK